jgi:hypothetical protein
MRRTVRQTSLPETKVRFKLGALEVETLGATTAANNQEASASDDPAAEAGVAVWDKLVAENEKPPDGGTKDQ